MLLRHLSPFEIVFDFQDNFDRFYSILLDLLDRFYPERLASPSRQTIIMYD